MTTLEKIQEIITEITGDTDPVSLSTQFEQDLEFNHNDIGQLIILTEENFGIELDEDELNGVKDVEALINLIKEYDGKPIP